MILNQGQIVFCLLALLGVDTVTELSISIFKLNMLPEELRSLKR
jgi:hypothetical protein